jgi:diacylglycerol kinase family enzyme
MSADTLLVVNPWATKITPRVRAAATRALVPGGLRDVIVTREPGEAGRRIRAAVADGARTVVCLGGDGTLAEVAGALADGEAVTIPLPGGGTNVFARAVGWPASLEEALHELPGALTAGRTARLRLGEVRAGPNRRSFVMNAGVGVDAEVVHWVEGHPGLKRRLHQMSFVLGAARVGLRYARRPPELRVSVDGEAPLRVAALVATCGRPYTFLGSRPIDLVPGASFDGTIAWRGLVSGAFGDVARVFLTSLGGHAERERSTLIGGVAHEGIVIEAAPPTGVQADGEPLGWHPHVELRPGPSLRVLLPRRALVPAEHA